MKVRVPNLLILMILCVISFLTVLEAKEIPRPLLKAIHSPHSFVRLHLINKMGFFSQASQDQFVCLILYGLLGKQDSGYYLEIGAGDPININNSYFFEKKFKWKGISIDIIESLAQPWSNVRKNALLIKDATTLDYDTLLHPYPKVIDYLSLDIDGQYTAVLKKIPFEEYLFKVITIEHDCYRFGDVYREEEREFLASHDYHLLCSNVLIDGRSFEDWWIHPSFFSSLEFSVITSLDLKEKEHSELIMILKKAIYNYF